MDINPVLLDVVFRSRSGKSLAKPAPVQRDELEEFQATEQTRSQAVEALRQLGFEIVGPASPFGVSISGSPELVRQVFGEGELRVPFELAAWIESVRIPPKGEYYW